MCVTDFAETYDFYTSRFNFVPSDVRNYPRLNSLSVVFYP